ncbi:MAG: tyrosine-type recombinase/integrase [Gammaproteobacteria bacterium]|nr:tyrosine-type recombinase/integrase [Gammaproteobacteria bacterium]
MQSFRLKTGPLTGLRRQEAASLCWQNIDLKDRTLTIEQTKNHQRHVLPLSDYLYELILRRRPFSQQHHSDYLFPAESETGHLKDPRKAMLKIAELSGVPFTIHDLRRTFITIAESLDIPAYALKRLLNHATTNDVTADYIIIDVERLRRPMQKITDHILALMGIKDKHQQTALGE